MNKTITCFFLVSSLFSITFFAQQNKTFVCDDDRLDRWVVEEKVIDSLDTFLFEPSTARFKFLFRTGNTNLTDSYTTSSEGLNRVAV
jgi:hypothetical protein